ncbi:MAG: hypothetical protein R6V28_05375 [Nitriliruptoraceae bacterium]
MTYAVHHVDAADHPQLEEFPSLEAGLARVEALRNDGEVSEVRVFKEIPIEVRTYYRAVAVEDPAVAEVTVGPAEGAAPPPVDPGPSGPAEQAERDRAEGEDHRFQTATEPPSGAMVMAPPPVATPPEVAEPVAAAETEHRRPLFGRG